MARPKTYIIQLNDDERTALDKNAVCPATITNIIQMACSPVPDGHPRWTLRLLEYLVKFLYAI